MNFFNCCQPSQHKINQKQTILNQSRSRIRLSYKSGTLKNKIGIEKIKLPIKLSKPEKGNKQIKSIISSEKDINLILSLKNIQNEQIRIPQQNIQIKKPQSVKIIPAPMLSESQRNVLFFQYQPVQQIKRYPVEIKPVKINYNPHQFLKVPKPAQQFETSKPTFGGKSAPLVIQNKIIKDEKTMSINSTDPSSYSVAFSAKKLQEIDAKRAESICDSSISDDEISQVLEVGNKLFLSHLVSTDEKFFDTTNDPEDVSIKRKACPQQFIDIKSNELDTQF